MTLKNGHNETELKAKLKFVQLKKLSKSKTQINLHQNKHRKVKVVI